MSTESERYLDRVRELPCFICQKPAPSSAHHIRAGMGKSQKASDFLTIPLCHEHHQGRSGIHGDRSEMRLRKLTELDLLADTIRRLEA